VSGEEDLRLRARGLAVVAVVAGGLGLAVAAWLARSGATPVWPAGLLALVGGLAVLGGLVAAFRGGRQVMLSPNGLVLPGADGGPAALRWDQVASVVPGAADRTVVVRRDGGRLVLDRGALGASYERTVAALERGVTAAMLPGALAELRAGREVAFGPVIAGPDGLHHAGTTLAWHRLTGIETGGTALTVGVRGEPDVELPAAEVPNAFVLAALAAEFTGTSRSG
jgi:hypothetical protein